MATGSYDANGIWQYGEDDNIALFSDLLNLATESTSDAFTDDRARIATLEGSSLSGLIPVVASSISYAGTSAAVNTLGAISLNAVTSISINGVFTPSYRNYRIVWTGVSSVGAGINLLFKLRKSGVDTSTSVYDRTGILTRTLTGTVDSYSVNGASVGMFSSSTLGGSGFTDLYSPQVSMQTTMINQNVTYDGSTLYNSYQGYQHKLVDSYDGFTLTASSGNFSGLLTIYAYND